MVTISEAEVPQFVQLLSKAFRVDPHVEWFIGRPRRSRVSDKRRLSLMNYLVEASRSIGEAWRSESGLSVALWLRNDAKPHGAAFLAANLGYLLSCGLGATLRSLRAESKLGKRLGKGPWLFLWTVGVDEAARGKGELRRLLEPKFSAADQSNIPIFLETAVERNVAIYRHYGFEVREEYEVAGLAVAFMARPPRSEVKRPSI